MIDRVSTFADARIIELLKTQAIPVALDQAYQRRQQDAEGDFYRKIADQGRPSSDGGTTQGLYIANADGSLLGFTNNRGPDRVLKMIREGISKKKKGIVETIEPGKSDPRFSPSAPPGGMVVRVQAKVLDGYDTPKNAAEDAFQSALSRDNLWVTAAEQQELIQGRVATSLLHRIAKFHLVDNTRGEPPMWTDSEIQAATATIINARLTGEFKLASQRGDRAFDAVLYGIIEHESGHVRRLDLVVKGTFRGEGPYTRGAPKQPFPLGISFTLADGTDAADSIPPQGSRGWVAGYLQTH